MKNIILLSLFLLVNNCDAQKTNNNLNNSKMKFYNENEYKNWKWDPKFCSNENPCKDDDKSLMNGNERARIFIFKNNIQVERCNVISPYKDLYVYYLNNKSLRNYGKSFYSTNVGIWKEYNEKGILIKETNWDEPYKISIIEVVKK